MSKIEYSIVIPVFCAQNSLEKLHINICNYFEGKYSFEIIYVDDCSTDNSWEALKGIKQHHANTTIIRFNKNFGQHAATICGFKHAKGDFIVTMDDDLEVMSSEIEKLINAQKRENGDIVYAEFTKLNQSTTRGFFTNLYKGISKLVEGKEKGRGSSYRLLKSNLVKKMAENHSQFVFIDELCLWYTNKVSFVQVEANRDFIKKTRYKLTHLFFLTGNVIMLSSTFPLRLVTRIGLILSTFNFFLGVYFLTKKFYFKIEVHGYTSIIVSILFSTGLIIFCIGILAQYIAQLLKASNNYPTYYEDEVIC